MKTARRFALPILAVAVLAACNGGGPSGAVPKATQVLSRGVWFPAHAGRDSLVYVGDEGNDSIAIFERNGKRIGTVSDSLDAPGGLFVDRSHNLWVANDAASSALEFARGGSSPIVTLKYGNAYTQDVTVCPNGDVFVASLLSGIAKYTDAKHKKSGSLDFGGPVTFVTCDAKGNVFATGVRGTNGSVVEFPKGKNAGSHTLPIYSAGNLGGIKPDTAGNILVSDEAGHVTEYTEDGAPTGRQVTTGDLWIDIALSRDGKTLLAGDQTLNAAVAVSWPDGRVLATYTGSFSNVLGVAFDPGPKL